MWRSECEQVSSKHSFKCVKRERERDHVAHWMSCAGVFISIQVWGNVRYIPWLYTLVSYGQFLLCMASSLTRRRQFPRRLFAQLASAERKAILSYLSKRSALSSCS